MAVGELCAGQLIDGWGAARPLIILMQSVAPHIIKHFIPLDFSRNILDRPLAPAPLSPPKDDNPLQNIKLKRLSHFEPAHCVLTFNNKSHPQFQPKHPLARSKIIRLMQREERDLQSMRRTIQQEHNQQNWRRTLSTVSLPKQSAIRVRAVKEEPLSNTATRTSPTRNESRTEQRKAMTARASNRPSRTGSTHRPNPEGGVFVRSSSVGKVDLKAMRIKGVRAPNEEVMNPMRRPQVNSARLLSHH